MSRDKKILYITVALIVAAIIGVATGIYIPVINSVVEKQTVDTISELAEHDRNTISMYAEFNWKNLQRVGLRLKRKVDSLTTHNAIYEYLSYEAYESPFDRIFIITEDAAYFTDVTYRKPETDDSPATPDYYDYTKWFNDASYKTVGLDKLPFMGNEPAIIYGYKMHDELEGMEITLNTGEKFKVFALVGICNRATIKEGLVINSFTDGNGNARGFSSVVTKDGDYIVNYFDNADANIENWFDHISQSGKSEMSIDQLKENMQAGKDFYFFFTDNGVTQFNYCMPLNGATNWYFVLSVEKSALTEQSATFIELLAITFGLVIVILAIILILVIQITKKKDQALIKERVQSEFLANMSHEIRTPLNGIVGLNYLMMTAIDDPKKKKRVKEWLSKSHSASKYLLSLVNDVLDVSKLRAGKMDIFCEPMSVEGVIDAIGSMQHDNMKNRDLRYSTDVAISYPYILCDEVRLKQVLMNIVSNAAKFTPAGGSIKLSVKQEKRDDNHVLTTFVCEDTGCGMSQEFLTKIFDMFTQNRHSVNDSTKGTGLGMYISKMIVDALGGTISVESEVGKGSKFTVVIPSKVSDLPEYVSSSVTEETEHIIADTLGEESKSFKILVAEDNDLNAEILIEVLQESGFVAVRAENGQRAVDIFSKSEVGEFKLVLMDMRMPVMDGCEASKAIRELERPDAKTVFIYACTANTFNEDRIKAFDSGMNDFLTKPIDITVLLQKMETIGKKPNGVDNGDKT